MKKFISIEGMSCGHCVAHVKNALEEVEGIESARVDLDTKSAEINLTSDVADELISQAVEEAGYKVVEIRY